MTKLQRLARWFKALFITQPILPKRPKNHSKKAWFYGSQGKPTLAQQLYLSIGARHD